MRFNMFFKRMTTLLLGVVLVSMIEPGAKGSTVLAATSTTVTVSSDTPSESASERASLSDEALDNLGVPAGETGFICMILDDEDEIVVPNALYEYVLESNRKYTICSYYIWHGEYDGDVLHDAKVYVEIPTTVNDDVHGELIFHFDNNRQPLNMTHWLLAEHGNIKIELSEVAVIISDAVYIAPSDFSVSELQNAERQVKLGNSGALNGNLVYREAAMESQIRDGLVELGSGIPVDGTPIVMMTMFVETKTVNTISPLCISIAIVILVIIGAIIIVKAKRAH